MIENQINDLEYGFHNKDGWMFRRDSDDGHVRIWKIRHEKVGLLCTCDARPFASHQTGCAAVNESGELRLTFVPVLEAGPLVIPENEWASIVASVSRNGETASSWQYIRDFHNGGCKR